MTNGLLRAPDAPWPHSQHRWQEEPAFISTPATTVLTRLLPDPTLLRLEVCDVDDTTAQITLRVQSTQTCAPCPLCATPARRIHSDYGRTLADLPWAQYRVGRVPIFPVRLPAEQGVKSPYGSTSSTDPLCSTTATGGWPRHWRDTKRGSPLSSGD